MQNFYKGRKCIRSVIKHGLQTLLLYRNTSQSAFCSITLQPTLLLLHSDPYPKMEGA